MSDFTKLKAQRKAKEIKSYSSRTVAQDKEEGLEIPEKRSSPRVEVPAKNAVVEPKLSDDLYKSLPQTLEIRVDNSENGSGRGLYSRYSRRPGKVILPGRRQKYSPYFQSIGDILLSITPHIAALSNERLEDHCSKCFGTGSVLRRCTGCKIIFYCDSTCQSKDWSTHKQECSALQQWLKANAASPNIPGDAIRCLGRMIWKKRKLGKESLWSQELDAMQSHRASLSKDANSHESQVYTQLAHALIRFLGLNSPQEMIEYGMKSAADLVDIVSQFTTNTFTISSPELTPLGACISPLVALINHSCEPNAVVVFPRATSKDQEPLMQVILTSYIDTSLPRALRQKQLRETYYFNCRCSLCTQKSDFIDLREAMFCSKRCGGMCPLPTEENSLVRCNKCQIAVKDTDAVLDAVRVGQEGLDKADALQFSDPQKTIQLTTNLVPILTSVGLVPAAHPLLGLSRLLTSLLIAYLPSYEAGVEEIQSPEIQKSQVSASILSPADIQEALDETVKAATRSCTGLSQILTQGHPVRGIALAELGKLLCVDEPSPKDLSRKTGYPSGSMTLGPFDAPSGPQRLKLAYDTLRQARAELMIGFGGGSNEGGEAGNGVRNLLVNLEKEMAVWKDGVKNVVQDARLAGLQKS
ncbi:hypothetical protein CPB83DRAFT_870963 [Crepidotus variabilis]|uniref:MYND-type domain-containing protein n=1 Tax=Crepidotus variabilis TaxID=179855 RepID=A0A9P6EA98_9AGAR|nr:hypothetical protein CPB83DRAFT_870963 [Crepidotus variabilis]